MDVLSFSKMYSKELLLLISPIVALLGLVFRSYLSERGKLKAQIKENKTIVEQSESIKNHYQRSLEELKKEHQLDVTKRKYQYESKKDVYIKFFRMIDEFSERHQVDTKAKFLPLLNEFNRNILHASNRNDKNGQTRAITVFQKKLQALTIEANKDLFVLKSETNTIRLLASDDVLNELDLLIMAFEKSFDIGSQMLNGLPALILSADEDKIQEIQRPIEAIADVINTIKGGLIKLMREELNNI